MANLNIFLTSKNKILMFLFDISKHCTDKYPEGQYYASQTSILLTLSLECVYIHT